MLAIRSECQVAVAESAPTCSQVREVGGPNYTGLEEGAKSPTWEKSGASSAETSAAKLLPELPALAKVKNGFRSMLKDERKFKLLELAMHCRDSTADSGIDCEGAGLYCEEDGDSGRMVRVFCPKTCKACAALNPRQLTASSMQRAKIMKLLEQPFMTEGPSPKVSVKETDKLVYAVVDDFLPVDVVLQTARLAKESLFWQPTDMHNKQSWVLGLGGGGRGSPRDANGLYAPHDKAGGFPGLQMPPNIKYAELFWARLQSLKLPKLLQRVMFDKSADYESASWAAFHQMVCRSPDSLHVDQTRPHVDKDLEPPALAIVHFITNWTADQAVPSAKPTSGGVAFYGERMNDNRSLFGPDECAGLQNGQGSIFCRGTLAFDCSHGKVAQHRCNGVKATPRTGRKRQYIGSADDSSYTFLKAVEHKFNRAVIYSAHQLHSTNMDNAALAALSCKPTKGRVVTSVFIR